MRKKIKVNKKKKKKKGGYVEPGELTREKSKLSYLTFTTRRIHQIN